MSDLPQTLSALCERITAPDIDTIIAVWVNDGPNRGTVILQCYDKAWAAGWGATGTHRVEVFFLSCDVDYLVGKFTGSVRATKREKEYLGKIISSVQKSLRSAAEVA